VSSRKSTESASSDTEPMASATDTSTKKYPRLSPATVSTTRRSRWGSTTGAASTPPSHQSRGNLTDRTGPVATATRHTLDRMSPMFKLILLVAAIAAIWWVVTSVRASRGASTTAFTPVEQLSPEVQQTIDAALDRGELIGAIKHYRAATGAGLAESKAAVETRRWKRDG
jgi:ribosomal protein L7/L12